MSGETYSNIGNLLFGNILAMRSKSYHNNLLNISYNIRCNNITVT